MPVKETQQKSDEENSTPIESSVSWNTVAVENMSQADFMRKRDKDILEAYREELRDKIFGLQVFNAGEVPVMSEKMRDMYLLREKTLVEVLTIIKT